MLSHSTTGLARWPTRWASVRLTDYVEQAVWNCCLRARILPVGFRARQTVGRARAFPVSRCNVHSHTGMFPVGAAHGAHGAHGGNAYGAFTTAASQQQRQRRRLRTVRIPRVGASQSCHIALPIQGCVNTRLCQCRRPGMLGTRNACETRRFEEAKRLTL